MPGHAFQYGCLDDLGEIARPNAEVALELSCTRCGALSPAHAPIVAVHPSPAKVDHDWDGIMLPFIVRCATCGAEDQYELEPAALAELRARAARAGSQGSVVRAELRSWDGFVPRRPVEMLRHLLEIARRDPSCGEGWRRYGNVLEKLGRVDGAEKAWRRAVEVDENEFDAAVCLAELSHRTGTDDAWERIACALRRCSAKHWRAARQAHADARRRLGSHYDVESTGQRRMLIELLLDVLEARAAHDHVGLEVAWALGPYNPAESGGQIVVTLSGIDLSQLTRWDRLAEFLASDLVIGAHLAAPPEERPTFLEAFLASDAPLTTLDRLPLGALRDTTVAPRRPEPQAAWRSSSKKRNRHRRIAEAR
ncbi:MAG TPA: tetratricopeptide repeat protein [Candidatus Krumholzibacteria bacterium]